MILLCSRRLLGSEADDQEDEINLVIPDDNDPEEEEKDEVSRRHATEIDVESVLVKSVTHTYDKSSSHCLRVSATTPFSLHKQASMSVFANRSQSQFTTLPQLFRKDQ